jgi:hypothetical protein
MYTITVKNRFAELGLESDCSTVKYENFIQANKEAAEALIVQKKRNKQKRASGDPRVQTARTNVQTAFSDYQVKSSDENQCKLQTEKMNLSNVYDTIMEEDLTEMIKQVEEADAKSRHGESWRLINNISGRKSAKRGLLKGSTKEERINKWYQHFSNLLGKEPDIANYSEKDLPVILKDLNINDSIFTLEELSYAKKKLTAGKASGPDDIPPEVIKLCDFDDMIITFANESS